MTRPNSNTQDENALVPSDRWERDTSSARATTALPALTGSLPRQGRTAGLVSPKIRGCERPAVVAPAHSLEAAFRAGPLGATGRDAEEDDDADAEAAPNQVEEALDAWIARNLAALQERAEQGRSAFEQRLAEAGQGLPRSARGRIGVRVRPQRANRATPGAFSIEWVTYRHVHTAAGVVYLSDYIRKGDGDRYPKSAFRGIARDWQRPLVEEAEQEFGAIRAAARQIAEVRTRFRAAAKRCRELGLDDEAER
ncbi:conjugative transfer protein MobI(A/C) [Thiocapsa marina]|uniref:Uncharacterized protein n=1 Tax=Thiocapsa marina 5811 TaxID=768671 RepID=F9UAH1_9GAMM|nr:conjugative transfer protein MobI(A/C) [Thiocapsa marina]EGV19119.1 hypothetical protein ThimaDRAFT_1923 [Thiocapsa marina 5811]